MKTNGTVTTARWPAAKLERRRVSQIRPNPRNPNKHSKAQVEQIRKLIERVGWTVPLLVDEADVLLAGHGRLDAAKQLRLAWVPVVVARGWSEDDKRAYLIADNELTRNSSWDVGLLAEELREFNASYDRTLTGFTELEIERFTNPQFDPVGEDDQGLGAGHFGATDGRSIKVTRDQYGAIRKAIDQARELHDKPEMSEGAALEKIAESYSGKAGE
jgi:hypothetical protein